MNKVSIQISFVILIWVLSLQASSSQPVNAPIGQACQRLVYPDLTKRHTYYYSPGKINVRLDQDNKPQMSLLSLRYTGSHCYRDTDEKRFFNQFQVEMEMEPIHKDTIRQIRDLLKLPKSSKIKPLPIQELSAHLLVPVADEQGDFQYRKLGSGSTTHKEKGTSNNYWSSRIFTIMLEASEAELLQRQIKEKQLGISFSYTFYSEMADISSATFELQGDEELIEGITAEIDKSNVAKSDTTLYVQPIISESFALDLDSNPDWIKNIDINEQMPPAYGALELRCYDFKDQLRPDIFMKTVEIEAVGISGKTVRTDVSFKYSQPDLHTHFIQFKYAIRMNEPIRYRVIQYDMDGNESIGEWNEKDICSSLIDVTTPSDDNAIQEYTLDMELNPETLFSDSSTIQQVDIIILYQINSSVIRQEIPFQRENPPHFQTLTFKYHKEYPIQYQIIHRKMDHDDIIGEILPLDTSFLYIE